ncbi:cell division FtsA domain-containing protein [Clostridium sp. LP20]|uniref:cell division FtsA domain-containing protein n=1 Tax=Clostridium sp. LP20 TaxID=3418665 RepID=UPI003EE46C1B
MEEVLVASIDFGSKKISASLGRCGDEDIDILGTAYATEKGMEKGLVKDKIKCMESLKSVITKLETSTNEKITDIYAGISSRNLRITEISANINLTEGKVRAKDIRRAIERGRRNVTIADGEEIVDILINFYSLDEKVINESIIGWKGNTLTLNLTVILGPTKELDKFREVISGCGYNLKGFIVNIITGKEIFLNGKSAMGIKALVDIGGGTSDIAIFRNGIIKYIYSLPIGGNNITKDLSICGKFSMGEAEKLKTIYSSNYETLFNENADEDIIDVGTTKVSRTLFYEVAKARIEELLKYVNIELKNTSFFDGICSIIIYGDGIAYFENVSSVAREQIHKKTTVVTKDYLGMQNPANVTSLAIVKEVYDRLKLVYEDSTEVEIEKKIENEVVREILNEKKEREGILGKFRSFLEDIF